MPVRTDRYNPLLISERVEPNDVGQLDLCRAASFLMVWDAATNGDATTYPNGKRWGKARIRNTLAKMRRATGDELRGSYNTGHMDEFAKGAGIPPNAWEPQFLPFASLVQGLQDGYAYTLSGDVRHTPPGSPLRKYVNGGVGHDTALIRISDDLEQIAFIDPMTPHGTAKYLRWAPRRDFRLFAKEFETAGSIVSGRIKKGYYSVANRRVRSTAALALDAQKNSIECRTKLAAVREVKAVLETDLAAKGEQIAVLQTQLTECQAGDPSNKLARITAIVLE